MSTLNPTDPDLPGAYPGPQRSPTPPGEGERRAQRGYTRQYDAAAAAIYHGLDRGDLRWVGLADRCAGIADDVVLGYDGDVVGHQFKTSRDPRTFRIRTLLTGASGLLPGLVVAWDELRGSCPGQNVRIRVVVSDVAADNDDVGGGAGSTRQFVSHWQLNPSWSMAEWRTSPWWPIVEHLWTASSLAEPEFEEFFRRLELIHGNQADFATRYGITAQSRPQVDLIAQRLPKLVARVPEQDRWTREEFLREIGWRDTETRHRHQFPIGIAVQRNPASEIQLRQALAASPSGYLSLVGPPGSGKSTLLQIALESEPQLTVVRYLAFVPGAAQGIGRAEAADFHEDLIVGLRRTGLPGVRFRRESPQDRREEFEALLAAAGQRFQETGVRTLVVVDGLDHVPREERPERSFLSELPLPASVPQGVIFLLGTQRLDLPGILPAVRDQADTAARRVDMAQLSQAAISSMADAMGLPESMPRSRLRELAHGHPLATHYLIQALLSAESEQARNSILRDGFEYAGDIEAYYASALRGLTDDDEVMDILGLVALSEAPLDLSLLEHLYSRAALERVWRAARHLLKRSQGDWSIFHNSFRLYVARVPRFRFGEPDTGSSSRLYRRLVEVVERAGPDSPQRFLRLRYLMRVGEHAEVLAAATPAFFREQYLAGRSASDIRDDIRLAFSSLKDVRDATAAFNLILASDEISRRAFAFEDDHETIKALIALGQVDEAEELLDETGGDGYDVVDAWQDQGNIERARTLFERIEPLHDLGSDSSMSSPMNRQPELQRWAARAVDFRSPSEIMAGINRIVEMVRRERDQFNGPDDLGWSIRWEAALATVTVDPSADIDVVIEAYELDPSVRPTMRLLAVRCAQERATSAIAEIDDVATDAAELAELPRGLRRGVSLMAARSGAVGSAQSLAAGLAVPAIAEMDDSTDYGLSRDIPRAVIEHAELVTLLNEAVPTSSPSSKPQLVPLQQFAEHAGILAARSRRDPQGMQAGEVAQECAAFMRYVCRTVPGGGGEYFVIGQLDRAAPEVLNSLLKTAARINRDEFARAIEAVDRILEDRPMVRDRTFSLEMMIAKAVANLGQNADDAERRLDGLLERRDQGTPGQFLESTARLAEAFACVGRQARGQALLAEQRAHTLGYALRAKKDPQYAFWMSLLGKANQADPGRRSERVRVLARQAIGMASTEGRDAAGRIAHGLILEAAMDSAQLGSSVADALLGADLIEMPEIVDALMTGMIRRDPRLVIPCVETWLSLCMPFHRAAFYRASEEGNFIHEAIQTAGPKILDDTGRLLLDSIAVHAQVDVRPTLVDSLKSALSLRGADLTIVEAARVRTAGDTPLPRSDGNSPMPYDDALDMRGLADKVDADAASGAVSFEAGSAFRRLVPGSDFNLALEVFDRHPKVQEDNRARFALVDRALAEGQREVAIRLTNEYQPDADRSFSWSWMMGGGRQRYFHARLQLEGESVYELAYANLASSLAAGDEATNSLLWDLDDIWPLLEPAPNWSAMWASVQDQLPHTRDYALGRDVDHEDGLSDAALIAKLFHKVISLPVSELQWQAGRGALSLSASDPAAFGILINSLLSGSGDSIIKGLQLLRSTDSPRLQEEFASRIGDLANHDDFGVRILASKLAEHWRLELRVRRSAVPAFYGLALPPLEVTERVETLREQPFGAPLVSDAAAWCAPFTDLIEKIASIAEVTEDHIRHRVQQLIDGWGGVQAFGSAGAAELRGTLQNLGLQLQYFTPHFVVGLRALRRVAGELDGAGRIDTEEVDSLLGDFAISLEWMRSAIDRRPNFVVRPALPRGFTAEEEPWLAQVEEDITAAGGTETILAELTYFQGRSSFTAYEWSRMRLLGTRLPPDADPVSLFERLPHSGFPVRAVTRPGLASLPRFELTLDPGLANRLGWQAVTDGTSRWFDANGQLVATAYCWRDGGPDGQTHGDCLYGEGAAIALTEVGRTQLEGLVGPRGVETVARRARLHNAQNQQRFAASRPPDALGFPI
ncbi:AAA family ATPase [Lysobacter sp. A421]